MITEQLASGLGRRDEIPNIELAKKICDSGDRNSIGELVRLLEHKKKAIRHDAMKTLYEIGYLKPDFIAPYDQAFMSLLDTKDNRMQWGAMTALSAITKEKPSGVYQSIVKIIAISDRGSVITRDHCIRILTTLMPYPKYRDHIIPLFFEQVRKCPSNQLPKYAEDVLGNLPEKYYGSLSRILISRLDEMEKESKRKRLEKVIKKLG